MRKPEFSKIVLAAAIITWLSGAVFGGFIVSGEPALLGELLAYIGAPTATAFGFYAWKAKAENVLKITQAVESNQKITSTTKKRIISGIAKALNDVETEDFNNGD